MEGCQQVTEVQGLGGGERPVAWGCSEGSPVRDPREPRHSSSISGKGTQMNWTVSALQELRSESPADPEM